MDASCLTQSALYTVRLCLSLFELMWLVYACCAIELLVTCYFIFVISRCLSLRSVVQHRLVYMMIQPDVAAETGAGRDEANRLSTRGHGSCPKPCWLK